MPYTSIFDNIIFESKGHDCPNIINEGSYAFGIICDGVSRTYDPAWGAHLASSMLCKSIKSNLLNSEKNIDYNQIYEEIVQAMNFEAVTRNENLDLIRKSIFATTVITGLLKDFKAEFTYSGNGAIIEIRQEWFKLPNDIPTPWGVNNYLNPHSYFNDGENTLFKVVKATKDLSNCMPDKLTLENTTRLNSYFLICSDGLYSSDEIETGWIDNEKDYYLKENKRLILFLKLLRKYHGRFKEDTDLFIDEFKLAIIDDKLLVDDLSYVLFIPDL